MSDALLDSLKDHRQISNKPLRVLFLNTGGTFSCLPNEKGLLEPLQSEKELKTLLQEGLGLKVLEKKGLLQIRLRHVFSVDSSQIEEPQRDQLIKTILPEYSDIDGVIVMHGTDTAADTAKYLHLALPYYDPRAIWKEEPRTFNWSKPVIVLSSQVPSIDSVEDELTQRIDSDGPMNLSVALMTIADAKVGETGLLTNGGDVLRGSAAEKGAEVDIPPFRTDPGVPPAAKFTALGLRYNPHGFLQQTGNEQLTPFVINGASEYVKKVMTVSEASHLNFIQTFLDADPATKQKLKAQLPEVIIYISKGAGNVMKKEYEVIKKAEKEGVYAFRVPIPGGRIPDHQMYDVPGHDIPALNMQPQTARYKAMMVLFLAERVFKLKAAAKKIFINKMMQTLWSNEFLPRR